MIKNLDINRLQTLIRNLVTEETRQIRGLNEKETDEETNQYFGYGVTHDV